MDTLIEFVTGAGVLCLHIILDINIRGFSLRLKMRLSAFGGLEGASSGRI